MNNLRDPQSNIHPQLMFKLYKLTIIDIFMVLWDNTVPKVNIYGYMDKVQPRNAKITHAISYIYIEY